MSRSSLLFCFISLFLIHHLKCATSNPIVAVPTAAKFLLVMSKAVDFVEKHITTQKNVSASKAEVLRRLDDLSTDFQDMKGEIIDKITNDIPSKLVTSSNKLFGYVKDVQRMYKNFLLIFSNSDKLTSSQLQDFSKIATTFSLVEFKTTLEKMHEALTYEDVLRESVISIIATRPMGAGTMCKRSQSPQQLLNELYEMVVASDVKGLLTILYALSLKEKYENENYEFTKKLEMDQYQERVQDTFEKVKRIMKIASRQVWKCNPNIHEAGKTYLKVGNVFQSYVVNKVDTRRGAAVGLVTPCSSYKDDRVRCRSFPCQSQPPSRVCTGRLRDCKFVDSSLQICHALPGSDRRYEWIKFGYGDKDKEFVYGREHEPCNTTQGVSSALTLDYCICDCESEQRDANRYFSLADVVSNMQENKVVTGLRIVNKNHVFMIEIQQGTLGANSTITDTPQWQQVDALTIDELLSDNISKHNYQVTSLPLDNDDHELKYEEWVDFLDNDFVYPITYKQRTVFLDDLEGPSNTVLTGIRFASVNSALRLEIRITKFDPATGQLDQSMSSWRCHSSNIQQRAERALDHPDDPTRKPEPDDYSENNQYIRFRTSDLKHDLSQNTVPFIDLQAVETNPPTPLVGAGLYHRGGKSSGGFLALKLIHFDFTLIM